MNIPTTFKIWFERTAPVGVSDDGFFVVAVQTEFARSWLDERYMPLVNASLSRVLGYDLPCRFVVDTSNAPQSEDVRKEEHQAPEEAPQPSAVDSSQSSDEVSFHSKFTFDSFVVGDSNVFARNVALAVAEQPGLKYNPLFIWGGSGLGKTHLLQAIGAYVVQNYPHKKVLYVTSEQFLNDYTESLASKEHDAFRQKYRSVDVLLLDDVQFMENKAGLQIQFFNTFNELHRQHKAIVLSSDKSPNAIDMEERFRSRFAWGIQADIQPPSYETRLAILKRFIESEGVDFEPDAISYIAEHGTPNIREMEGIVNRVIAFRDLLSRNRALPTITLELTKEAASDLFPDPSQRLIQVPVIQREVCRFFSVSQTDLVGSKRTHTIVYPRQIAMYLCTELTDSSLPKIGSEFGGRDHTTVMHARDKIRKMMGSSREVYNHIHTLTNVLKRKP